MDNFYDEFILDLEKNGVHIPDFKIFPMLLEVERLVEDFHFICSKQELVSIIINSYADNIKTILKDRNLIPGYLVALQVGNIKVQMMDGFRDYQRREKITENSLFDIASCTKLFTQIITYRLIDDGFFSFDSKVGDLDDRFIHLGNLKVKDITEFLVEFKTSKRLDVVVSLEDFYKTLYTAKIVNIGNYNYNDIGMMVLKEVMERVTGRTYQELLDDYILSKLGLNNTFVSVPQKRWSDITATPNARSGLANDPKAALTGASGHAGIFSNGSDLLKFSESLFLKEDLFPSNMVHDLYQVNSSDRRRSKIGNLFVHHPEGLKRSFVSNLQSKYSFQTQGSTRVTFGASKFVLNDGSVYVNSNAILLNPCSMNVTYAKYLEKKINRKLLEEWVKSDPLSLPDAHYEYRHLVKNFVVDDKQFQVIDPRLMVDKKETSDPVMELIGELSIRLMFLEKLLMKYEKINEEVKIIKKMK